jgi:hypothetical protein
MITLEGLGRRHLAGISALALTLAGLAYFATRDFPARPVAALPEAQLAQNDQSPSSSDQSPSFEERFLAGLQRLPANAFGSAEGLKLKESKESLDANGGADASQDTALSPASQSKFWSDREWRIASKAVDDFRANRKPQTKPTGALSWRPPEEIANKAATPQ